MLALLVLPLSSTAIAVASNNHHRLPSSPLSFVHDVRRRQLSPLLLDDDGTICHGCYLQWSDHPRDREDAITRRRISCHHPCRAFGGGMLHVASSSSMNENDNIGLSRTAHTATTTTNNEIELLLHKYGYTSHLVTFTNDEVQYKPKIAESYINGSWKLCFIVGLRQSSSSFATITANEYEEVDDDDNDSSHSKNKNNSNNGKPPLLEVITMNSFGQFDNNERKVIDIGQITTIWDQEYVDTLLSSSSSIISSSTATVATTTATAVTTIDILIHKLEYYYNIATKSLQNDILPIETTLSTIYNGRVAIRTSSSFNVNGKNNNNNDNNNNNNYRRNTSTTAILTKKNIPTILSQLHSSSSSTTTTTTANYNHIEELLHNLIKMGGGSGSNKSSSRLVDTDMVIDYLYPDYLPKQQIINGRRNNILMNKKDTTTTTTTTIDDDDDDDGSASASASNNIIVRKIVATRILAEDAKLGGRYKRRSCQYVTSSSNSKNNTCVTLVNGGWLAVDPSVKAAVEGRKFVTTAMASTAAAAAATTTIRQPTTDPLPPSSPILLPTATNERIVHRLECLAMGDVWKGVENNNNDYYKNDNNNNDGKMLELDVRTVLTELGYPLTPTGATMALLKIGIWSEKSIISNNNNHRPYYEPWSSEVLNAARLMAEFDCKRREVLSENCRLSVGRKKKKKSDDDDTYTSSLLEGRINLSSLPCICIDAERATFRDDAIGIRLRSSTGRKVNKIASKWEILVHIADVSDLFNDDDDATNINNYHHHYPNNVVSSLNLLRQAAERRGQSRYDLPLGPLHLLPPVALTSLSLTTNKDNSTNRCVTLWAYIDERDGRLLEAGIERTIISSPKALSFASATALLEDNTAADNNLNSMSNAKAILTVAERNLSLWITRHNQRNQAAQKREQRLTNRELISNELQVASSSYRINRTTKTRDDGVGHSFQRTRGHRMVDSSLELYAYAIETLMSRAKQPIPRAAGSGSNRRGRLGTAPLRRYIDGIAQKQTLSALCGYGKPLTLDECHEVSKIAARASDSINNIQSSKQSSSLPHSRSRGGSRQVSALYELSHHLETTGGINNRRQVKAMSTGRSNEVVIIGLGATGTCKGVKGTLKSGEHVLVHVDKIDPEVGLLEVTLVNVK